MLRMGSSPKRRWLWVRPPDFMVVIGEIRLSVLAAHEADGGDGVLVGAHGAVAAQTPQLAADLAGMGQLDLLVVQRGDRSRRR